MWACYDVFVNISNEYPGSKMRKLRCNQPRGEKTSACGKTRIPACAPHCSYVQECMLKPLFHASPEAFRKPQKCGFVSY